MTDLLKTMILALLVIVTSLCVARGHTEPQGRYVTLVLRRTKCDAKGDRNPINSTPKMDDRLEQALKKIEIMETLLSKLNETVANGQETQRSLETKLTNGQEAQRSLETKLTNGQRSLENRLNATMAILHDAQSKWQEKSKTSVRGLVIETDQATIHPGLATEHTINCTMDMGQSPPSVVSLASIAVARWNSSRDEYTSIAHISMSRPDQTVTVRDVEVEAQTSGHLDTKGMSFLSLHWNNPTHDAAGQYVCTATTLNFFGQPVQYTADLEIRAYDPSSQMLKAEMDELRAAVVRKDEQLQTERKLSATLKEQLGILKEQIGVKTELIQTQNGTLRNNAEMIATLNKRLQSKTEVIANQNENLRDKMEMIATLNKRLQNKTDTIANQNETLQNKTELIATLNRQLQKKLEVESVCEESEVVAVREVQRQKFALPLAPVELPRECAGDLPRTCKDVKAITPRQVTVLRGGQAVLCDTESDGGGWVVIQRRTSKAVDFYRNWTTYKSGFGSLDENFWLGNERIFHMTNKTAHELRIDIKYKGQSYHATYTSFSLSGEDDQYRLHLGSYKGGNVADGGLDFATYENNKQFSTKDRDNDISSSRHCGQEYKSGWWHWNCSWVNLNGVWASSTVNRMRWRDHAGQRNTLTFSEMKVRPTK